MPSSKDLESFKKTIQSLLSVAVGNDISDFSDIATIATTSLIQQPFMTAEEVKSVEEEDPAPSKIDKVAMDRYIKLVRGGLQIEPRISNSHITVVANRNSGDKILRIHCRGGAAISGYVYDSLNDCYCVKGVDYCTLGYVPIGFKLVMEQSNWTIDIPVPENVLRLFMTKRQKTDLKNFKDHYKDCKIYFLQLVD